MKPKRNRPFHKQQGRRGRGRPLLPKEQDHESELEVTSTNTVEIEKYNKTLKR